MKADQKDTNDKRCLLTPGLKPFRSQVKGKHSVGKEFTGVKLSQERKCRHIHRYKKSRK